MVKSQPRNSIYPKWRPNPTPMTLSIHPGTFSSGQSPCGTTAGGPPSATNFDPLD